MVNKIAIGWFFKLFLLRHSRKSFFFYINYVKSSWAIKCPNYLWLTYQWQIIFPSHHPFTNDIDQESRTYNGGVWHIWDTFLCMGHHDVWETPLWSVKLHMEIRHLRSCIVSVVNDCQGRARLIGHLSYGLSLSGCVQVETLLHVGRDTLYVSLFVMVPKGRDTWHISNTYGADHFLCLWRIPFANRLWQAFT